jgi:serine kinase of HPr protein (carbohydrate metabolism regulator)
MKIYASCVGIDHKAIILVGPSGIGKSDLALRLIDQGASLVADDQTELTSDGVGLFASAPAALVGMLEVRHIGLMHLDYVSAIPVALYVELTPQEQELERLPMLDSVDLLGHPIKRLWLPAFAASTPAKIHAVLRYTIMHDGTSVA